MTKEKDNLLERTLRKIIIFIVVMAFVVPLITPSVFAASSVSIGGGDHVKGGDTFTISVVFEGGNIGRVDAYMTYDTNKLTYISGGTSSGNTGYVQLKTASTEGSIVFQLEFQAVSEGAADLEVITDEMYDFDDAALDRPSAAKTITISGNAAPQALITETTSPEKPVDATELAGIDEKTENDSAVNLNVIFIAAAAVLVICIVIISIILAKKKKQKSGTEPKVSEEQHPYGEPPENTDQTSGNETNRIDRIASEETQVIDVGQMEAIDAASETLDEKPRIGRSGKVLDAAPSDDSWLDELMAGQPARKRRETEEEKSRSREQNLETRKQANEETELWQAWNLNTRDDDPDDIEKW